MRPAADLHVTEAASILAEWGYRDVDPEALRRIYESLPVAVQLRANAWRTVARIWVEEPDFR